MTLPPFVIWHKVSRGGYGYVSSVPCKVDWERGDRVRVQPLGIDGKWKRARYVKRENVTPYDGVITGA